MSEHRNLQMRANRLLGAALVDTNLIKIEALDAANERVLELMQNNMERQATLLGVLLFETKVLAEEDYLHHLIENEGLGLMDLRHFEVPEDLRKTLDLGECWATWTIPFDKEEDVTSVATAYYPSQAVRTHWEKRLEGRILWYATSLEIISNFLEKLEVDRTATTPPMMVAPAKPQ